MGNIEDKSLLLRVFKDVKPDVVVHAAAMKHIDLMEKNNDDFLQKTYLKTAIAKKENPDEYDKDFLKNNKAVDQVMIKLPFSESNGGELKV